MRKTPSLISMLLFVVAAMPCHAQVFKHHRIGEGFADFLKAEPTIETRVRNCQANAGGSGCESLLRIVTNGNGVIDGNGNENVLLSTLLAQNGGSLVGESIGLRDTSESLMGSEVDGDHRYFQFRKGSLVSFSLDLRAYFEATRDEISQRVGSKPIESAIPYHNAFGAVWNNRIAVWDSDSVHVELSQDGNPALRSLPYFAVESQELHRQFLKEQKNAPGPLD